MKILLLLLTLSSAFASAGTRYDCNVQGFRFKFKTDELMSTLLITDRRSGEIIFDNIVDNVQNNGERTLFIFQDLVMTFKSEEVEANSEYLQGVVDGTFGRGVVHQSIRCNKSESSF